MALNASGPISLGGSTAGQSINLELGQSATAQVSLNDTNVRSLAGVASGAIVMPTNFYGKSTILDTQTITIGAYYDKYIVLVGFAIGYMGSISDGTFNPTGGTTILGIYFDVNNSNMWFILQGNPIANSGWTTMTINGNAFTRASGTFSSAGGQTSWTWYGASNPFPGYSGTINAVFT